MANPAEQRPPSICTLVPYPGAPKTVSIRSLMAEDEYEKACSAFEFHKLADSEKHLRKALQRSPLDGFGWVMLGKILLVTARLDEASKACAEAVLREPSYWPGTICLAEIEARKQNWKGSLEQSDHAVLLNLDSKRVAYYISAVALYNLNNVREAEYRALEAERLDVAHQFTALRLLLAQIAEDKGDRPAAMTQLRDCITYGDKSDEGKSAKEKLARLERAPN
jgi:predicted Zn-dependent protease